MDEARRNEIAYALLRFKLKKTGMRIDESFRRSVGNMAKETGIPFPDVLLFLTNVAQELLLEVSDTKAPPTKAELKGFSHHDHHHSDGGH